MFIPQILKLGDWKTRLTKDRIGFLHEIIKCCVVNIPFQNITCIGSVEVSKRRTPTLEDALMAGLTGTGGLCGHNNTFMQYTLKSLGYDAHLAAGNFRRTGIPGSHVICIVKVPYTKPSYNQLESPPRKDESKWYIVDVGCSMALHEPLAISKLPYKGRAGGLNFRYEQLPSGIVQRVNECGDSLLGPKSKDYLSPQDYTIDLTPVKHFNNFRESVSKYFLNLALPLHHSLYCFRYLNITDSDFEVIWLRGTEMVIATKETRTVTTFKDYYEMSPVIHKYFPMINSNDIDIAVEAFSKSLPEENQKVSSA